MVTIKHDGITATIQGGVWACKDRALLRVLQTFSTEDVPGDVPNPDLAAARDFVNRLGGAIVNVEKVEYNKDVVY